eukprot:869335-Karenia_brevis.AAC.1
MNDWHCARNRNWHNQVGQSAAHYRLAQPTRNHRGRRGLFSAVAKLPDLAHELYNTYRRLDTPSLCT